VDGNEDELVVEAQGDTVRTGIVEQAVRRVLARDPAQITAAQEMLASLSDELDAGLR